MDYEKIKETAQNYQDDMTRFLRAIVKNPGESCDERKHIETIEAEMKKLNFDEVTIDPQGNVIGYMGNGDKILAFDAHIDTVGIGNIENWNFDPYEGYETDEEIGGRGVSDQCGGLVSAVYGAKIMYFTKKVYGKSRNKCNKYFATRNNARNSNNNKRKQRKG